MKETEEIERLLFVSRLRRPEEAAEARAAAEEGFPKEAFQRAGLTGYTVYVGGGYCIFEFGFEGDFDPIFENVNADESIQEYFETMGRHVDPIPRIIPESTAGQPIAADMFLWRIESGVKSRQTRGDRRRSPARPRRSAAPRRASPGVKGLR